MHKLYLLYRVDKHLYIKVADFGLARDVYISDYYRKQSTGKIPAKWMAPEALHDRISNEKTDVVSLLLCACSQCCTVHIYSGHLGLHVGRCLVLDVLPILLYLIMKYCSILMVETDHQNQISALISCKSTS